MVRVVIVSRRALCAQSTVDQRVCVTFDGQSFPTKKPVSFTAQVRHRGITIVSFSFQFFSRFISRYFLHFLVFF